MVEELICAGLQCLIQGGGKVLEGLFQLACAIGPGMGTKDSERSKREQH